VIPTKLRHY